MTDPAPPFEKVRPGVCGELRRGEPWRLPMAPRHVRMSASSRPFGAGECHAVEPEPAAPLGATYRVGDELAAAVNVALALGQPLLVTGEPGCGKTSLAYGVALQLGQDRVWRVDTRSTTTGDELFYRFDHVRRFHDGSLREHGALREAHAYVQLNALGAALRSEQTEVILLDEIDKAPRDLPNDLLRSIEEPMRFEVHELNDPGVVTQRARHLVVLTSNLERELPDAFLRRCCFVHLPFPEDATTLLDIVNRDLDGRGDPRLLQATVAAFLDARTALRERSPDGVGRLPGTSELLGWSRALTEMGATPDRVATAPLDHRLAVGALVKRQDEVEALQGLRAPKR